MINEIETILKKAREEFEEFASFHEEDCEVLTEDGQDPCKCVVMAELTDVCQKAITELLQALIVELEGEKKMGGEFGFCEHCKLHKGDYEHDYGTCNAYDSALNLAQEKLRK